MNTSRRLVMWLTVALLIAVGIGVSVNYNRKPGRYDSFAQCLTEKGAVFYGAFWCPHCQNQKAAFGKSARYLSYVECSTPDGRDQLALCAEKGIEGYPTWEFSDGSRESGEVTFARLAEKTGCPLPQ